MSIMKRLSRKTSLITLVSMIVSLTLSPWHEAYAESDYPGAYQFYRQKMASGFSNPGTSLSMGAATYSIPILLPEAAGRVQPSLQLNYNHLNTETSSGSAGVVGKGWSLGLLKIVRQVRVGADKTQTCSPISCPDGTNTVYNYGGHDLILDGPGGYDPFGCSATRYYREVDYGEKILFCSGIAGSKATDGTEASNYWTVIQKDGTIFTFGKRAAEGEPKRTESRLWTNPGPYSGLKPQVVEYYVDQLIDTHGFAWYAFYTDYLDNNHSTYPGGAPRLEKIEYPYRDSVPFGTLRRVSFQIAPRPDGQAESFHYRYGMPVVQYFRVTDILVEVGDARVRRYHLEYDADPDEEGGQYSPDSGASMLSKVTLYGTSDSESFEPVSFTYYHASHRFLPASETKSHTWPTGAEKAFEVHGSLGSWQTMMDLDGDGDLDLVYVFWDTINDVNCWMYYEWDSLENGFHTIPFPFHTWLEPQGEYIQYESGMSSHSIIEGMIDMDGDGLIDKYPGNGLWPDYGYYKNMGSYFTTKHVSLGRGANYFEKHELVDTDYATTEKWIDLNGNGCADHLFVGESDIWWWQRSRLCNKVPSGGVVDYSFDLPTPWIWNNGETSSRTGYIEKTRINSGIVIIFPVIWGNQSTMLVDINADGLVDLIESNVSRDFQVFFGTGRGFVSEDPRFSSYSSDFHNVFMNYDFPESPNSWFATGEGSDHSRGQLAALQDLNGDGLVDLIAENFFGEGEVHVHLNTGHGLLRAIPLDFPVIDYPLGSSLWLAYSRRPNPDIAISHTYQRFADIDGSGTLDVILFNEDSSQPLWIYRNENSCAQADLLKEVDNGLGGRIEYEYDSYNNLVAGQSTWGGKSQIPHTVVKRLVLRTKPTEDYYYFDEYRYEDAFFDREERLFRGFGTVEVETYKHEGELPEELHHFTRYRFYTGTMEPFVEGRTGYVLFDCPEAAGHVMSVEAGPSSSSVEREIFFDWVRDIHPMAYSGTFINRPRLTRTFRFDNKGGAYKHTETKGKLDQQLPYMSRGAYKRTETKFFYDDYMNLTEMVSYGDWDRSGDELTTLISYKYNTRDYLVSYPWRIRQCEGEDLSCPNLLTERRLYYDDCYCATPTQGDVTLSLERVLYDGEDRWVYSKFEYDDYGNLTSIRDPNHHYTHFSYHTPDHFSVDRIWTDVVKSDDPKEPGADVTLTTAFAWNNTLGKVERIWNPNGRWLHLSYDGLGRLIELKSSAPDVSVAPGSDPAPSDQVLLMDMQHTTGPDSGDNSVTETYYADARTYIARKYFLDGFGRIIQEKTAYQEGKYSTTNYRYGPYGLLERAALPYYTDSLDFSYFSLFDNVLQHDTMNYQYDWAGRLTEQALLMSGDCGGHSCKATLATMRYNEPDLWSFERDESSSHDGKTRYQLDAYDRIESVKEYDGAIYKGGAHYGYDPLGRLTNYQVVSATAIDSAQAGYRYDSRGLVRSMWESNISNCDPPSTCPMTYDYDNAGRLTHMSNTMGQDVAFRRDELGRVYYMDYCDNGSASCGDWERDVTLAYDDATTSMGALSWVDGGTLSDRTDYVYDVWGRQVSETRNAYDRTVTTTVEYDWLGRITKLIYPSGTEVPDHLHDRDCPLQGLEALGATSPEGPCIGDRVAGYHFEALSDNAVILELCGRWGTAGTRTVKLWNKDTGELLASRDVTTSSDCSGSDCVWNCSYLPSPLHLTEGTTYTVAADVGGSGGLEEDFGGDLPGYTSANGMVRILNHTYCDASTEASMCEDAPYPEGRPAYTSPDDDRMYGLVDIGVYQLTPAHFEHDQVRYVYDDAGGILDSLYWQSASPVGGPPSQYIIEDMHYDSAKRLTRVEWGNGIESTYTYNTSGTEPGRQQLKSFTVEKEGETLYRRTYTYYDDGTIASDGVYTNLGEEKEWIVSYEYDYAGRLIRATLESIKGSVPERDWGYRYDANGNLLRVYDYARGTAWFYHYPERHVDGAGPNAVIEITRGRLREAGEVEHLWQEQRSSRSLNLDLGEVDVDVFGYNFTAEEDTYATELCGFYKGAHAVKLWNRDTGGNAIATAAIGPSTADAWRCEPINPVALTDGTSYTVAAVAREGNIDARGSKVFLYPAPGTDKLTITSMTYCYTGGGGLPCASDGEGERPIRPVFSDYLYGLVDVGVGNLEEAVDSGKAVESFAYNGAGQLIVRYPSSGSNSAYYYTFDGIQYKAVDPCPDGGAGYVNTYVFLDPLQDRSVKYFTPSSPCSEPRRLIYYYGPHFEISRENAFGSEDVSYDDLYILVGGRRIAYISDKHEGKIFYNHADIRGSIGFAADETGAAYSSKDFRPYGAEYLFQGTENELRYGYIGSEEDSESGLYHLGVRQYDPDFRRFLQPDPIVPYLFRPQALNKYSYARNDPVNLADRSGYQEEPLSICKGPGCPHSEETQTDSDSNGVLDTILDVLADIFDTDDTEGLQPQEVGGFNPRPGGGGVGGGSLFGGFLEALFREGGLFGLGGGLGTLRGTRSADYFVISGSVQAVFGLGITLGGSIVVTPEGKIGTYLFGPPPEAPFGLINTITLPSIGGSVSGGFGSGLKGDLKRYAGTFYSLTASVGEGPQGVAQLQVTDLPSNPFDLGSYSPEVAEFEVGLGGGLSMFPVTVAETEFTPMDVYDIEELARWVFGFR
jgi:RHS repeat-associated protein